MVKQILTDAGFIENETFKESRFVKPPKTTYAIYTDSFDRRGADGLNLLKDHTVNIELYSYTADPDAENRIEKTLDDYGIEYTKAERYWIQSEQFYQTIYTFEYIEK